MITEVQEAITTCIGSAHSAKPIPILLTASTTPHEVHASNDLELLVASEAINAEGKTA
jgi:hypothetical protein